MCNRHLDSTTVNDGHDGDIYCRADYNAKYGMKGYGFGQGAGTLMSVSDQVGVRVDVIAVDFDADIVFGDATDAIAANVFF